MVTLVAYSVASVLLVVPALLREPRLSLQVTAAVLVDVLAIVVLVFGTRKLKNMGSDLGGAVKGFRDGLREASADDKPAAAEQPPAGQIIDGEIKDKVKS